MNAGQFKNLLIISTLVIFGACSQGTTTNTTLKVSNAFLFGGSADLQAQAGGGLMVWGRSVEGKSFGKVLNNTDQISIPLPDGTWTFYAMTWEGEDGVTDLNSNSIFTDDIIGKVRCAKSSFHTIGSVATEPVTLQLSNLACEDSDFAGGAGSGTNTREIGNLKIELCDSLPQGAITSDRICSSGVEDLRIAGKTNAGSYRIRFESYKNFGSFLLESETILSGCLAANPLSDQGALAQQLNQIPAGDGTTTPFRMILEFYASAGCTGDKVLVDLPHGAKVAETKENARYALDGSIGPNRHKLYVIIGCLTNPTTGFAGGDGTSDDPFLICSVPQLHNILTKPSVTPPIDYNNSSYKLIRDLNLDLYSKGIDYPIGTQPSWYPPVFGKLTSRN